MVDYARTRAVICVVVVLGMASGCAGFSRPQECTVDIPVSTEAPKPTLPDKPHLPVADLTPQSPNKTVVRAYAASLEACQKYVDSLLDLLK